MSLKAEENYDLCCKKSRKIIMFNGAADIILRLSNSEAADFFKSERLLRVR